jgi:hypothetical protein
VFVFKSGLDPQPLPGENQAGGAGSVVAVLPWPSVQASWKVTGSAGAPVLQLAFSFDPSRYTAGGQDPPANAREDLPLYQALAYPPADPGGIAFTVETSLAKGPIEVEGDNLDLLARWLGSILAYLQGVAAEQPAETQPPEALVLAFPVPGRAVTGAQIFELTCSFTLARTDGVAKREPATLSGVARTTATLPPAGVGTEAGLRAFATAFEQALRSADHTLKVAYGPDRVQDAAATSATLWAVRVGKGVNPISYAVHPGVPDVFAPAPISTSLVSGSAPISPYVSGKGIGGSSTALTFAGVDLDAWMRQVFAAVDSLLGPELVPPLLVRDELKEALDALQEHKRALAGLYAARMQPVFVAGGGADAGTVRAVFEQTLLERLANAGTAQAALQYRADVVAGVAEPSAPSLHGAVVQNPATAAPGIAFTSARLPLTTQTGVPLAFLVTTPSHPEGATAAGSVSANPWYTASVIEHPVGAVPGITGDGASGWLQFVNPPPVDPSQPESLSADLGTVQIPMVLRAYPPSPSLVARTGPPTHPEAASLPEATEWTCTLEYSLPVHCPQDTVRVAVAFNTRSAPPPPAPQATPPGVFAPLAQFVAVYPEVRSDIAGSLAGITGSSLAPAVATAGAAVGAVNQMLGGVIDAVKSGGWGAAEPGFHAPATATGDAWSCTVVERPQRVDGVDNVLVVRVASANGPLPQVQIAGCTTAHLEGTGATNGAEYIFRDGSGRCLDFAVAQSIPRRSVVYSGLPILAKQDALATARVTRNGNLVPGQTTAPAFVYRTPEVASGSPLRPTVSSETVFDLAQTGPNPGPRSLKEHLATLFDVLTAGATGELAVQLVGTYTYSLNATGPALPVTLPIFVQPSLTVSLQAESMAGMIQDVASAVAAWFNGNQPSTVGGYLTFALTVMTSPATNLPKPLLSLGNLRLAVADIHPSLEGTTPQAETVAGADR